MGTVDPTHDLCIPDPAHLDALEAERTRRHDAEHVLRLIIAHPADAAELAREYFEGER